MVRGKTIILLLCFILVAAFTNQTAAEENTNSQTDEQTVIGLNLSKAVELALSNSGDIQSIELELNIAESKEDYYDENKDIDVDNSIDLQTSSPYRTKSRAEIETETRVAKYVLPKQAEAETKMRELQLQQTNLQVIRQTKEAYFKVLENEKQLEIVDLSLKSTEENLNIIKQKKEQGLVTTAQLLQAEAQLYDIQVKKEAVKNELQTSTMELNKLLGYELHQEITLEKVEFIDQSKETPLLPEILEVAKQNRPDYQSAQVQAELAKEINDIYQKYYSLENKSAKITKMEKEAEYLKAQNNFKDTERNLEIGVTRIYNGLNLLYLQRQSDNKNLEMANEVYRTTQLRYENGLATNLEVMQALNNQLNNLLKLTETEYQILNTSAQLEWAIGSKLNPGE